MSRSSFREMLAQRWAQGKFVCVGLDTSLDRVPPVCHDLEPEVASWLKFNQALVEATGELALAFKPNLAFYLAYGHEGVRVLEATCRFIKEKYPEVVLILDMKSADIGSTNEGYARFAFDVCGADAITVHHKHGMLAMKPYLDRADRGVIVVVRTSNPGADEFQMVTEVVQDGDYPILKTVPGCNLIVGQGYMCHSLSEYERVALHVAKLWNTNGNCAVVAGATNAGLARIRQIIGDEMPILIPGIGAQGGDVEQTVKAGRNSRGEGMIINSSRGIIYASSESDFAAAAAAETRRLSELINRYRQEP